MASDGFSVFADHIRLTVRLTPNGGRDAVEGFESDAGGDRYLKVRVRAVPENGKANKALTELIAKWFGVPKSAVSFISGETSRKKILRIEGDPEDFKSKLDRV
jgi:uncharacterized protein (TIGR00251 family)